jgi:hypothetical protein
VCFEIQSRSRRTSRAKKVYKAYLGLELGGQNLDQQPAADIVGGRACTPACLLTKACFAQ